MKQEDLIGKEYKCPWCNDTYKLTEIYTPKILKYMENTEQPKSKVSQQDLVELKKFAYEQAVKFCSLNRETTQSEFLNLKDIIYKDLIEKLNL